MYVGQLEYCNGSQSEICAIQICLPATFRKKAPSDVTTQSTARFDPITQNDDRSRAHSTFPVKYDSRMYACMNV